MTLANPQILCVSPSRQEEALRLVVGDLDSSSGEPLASCLAEASEDQTNAFRGLFEARKKNRLVGATWAQIMPGKTAILWAPQIVSGEGEPTRRALMQRATDFLENQGLSMAQSLVESRSDPRCPVLLEAGFEPLVDLQYLVSLDSRFPQQCPDSPLKFEPSSRISQERLARVVKHTYSQTKDCPKLCGVRSMAEVLQGYQETGCFSPERWWVLVHEGQDIGCLLMTDHPASDYLELLYMGVVPGFRGKGWGREIVAYAQWQTHSAGRSRMVLAVDVENQPALANYADCGLLCWDQKTIYWRRFS